tara:strand:+ start:4375 stop:5925 length:1551 start_codon:yes stop_codon:yes gene_type:complete
MRFLSWWTNSIITGILLTLSFPGPPIAFLQWVYHPYLAYCALIPLLYSLTQCNSRKAFHLGWVAGIIHNLLSLYWVAYTQGGGPAVVGGTFLLAFYLGLFTAVWAWIYNKAYQRWNSLSLGLAPILWATIEYALSLGELGFPWLLLGHGHAGQIQFVQFAAFTGVYGVSFWIVAINALILGCVYSETRDRRYWIGATIISFVVPWLYSNSVINSDESSGESIRVALIQPNQRLEEKWGPNGLENSLTKLQGLSLNIISEKPEIIIWPETALPCYLQHSAYCQNRIREFVNTTNVPLLTGASHYESSTKRPFNSAFFIKPNSSDLPSYAKMHLVPFGERTPYRDVIPFLGSIDWTKWTGDLGPAEFSPGVERKLFDHPKGKLGTLICFESVFPDLVRRHVLSGAQALINITNDSWFGFSAGPYQHALLNAMRAIENRVAIARSATTGQSLFIDRFGRQSKQSDLFVETSIIGEIQLERSGSFYTRQGDLFAWICSLTTAIILITLYRNRAQPHERTK